MSDSRHQDLLHAYLDGHLAESELPELERALQQDPVLCAWFAGQCRREVALHAALRLERDAAQVGTGRTRRARRRLLERRRNGYWSLAVAALLLVALGILALYPQLQRPAPLAELVEAAGASADGRLVSSGERLSAGAELRLAGVARLRFPGLGAELRLEPGSALVLAEDGLHLDAGRVEAAVERQAPGCRFRISTAQAQVTVVGTRFAVAAAPDRTRVEVQAGQVEVAAAGWVRRLDAGESVAIPADPPLPEPGPDAGVLGVALYDADRDRPIPGCDPLREGAVLRLAGLQLKHVGLVFRCGPRVQALDVRVQGPGLEHMDRSLLEQYAPFTFPADTKGDIISRWRPVSGRFSVRAQAIGELKGRELLGDEFRLAFTVVE